MGDFFVSKSQIAEEAFSQLRTIHTDIVTTREKVYEIELSMAALHNPDTMYRFFEADAQVKELEAKSMSLVNELASESVVIKTEYLAVDAGEPSEEGIKETTATSSDACISEVEVVNSCDDEDYSSSA